MDNITTLIFIVIMLPIVLLFAFFAMWTSAYITYNIRRTIAYRKYLKRGIVISYEDIKNSPYDGNIVHNITKDYLFGLPFWWVKVDGKHDPTIDTFELIPIWLEKGNILIISESQLKELKRHGHTVVTIRSKTIPIL
ncbi:MAG TPA: hypothetical protein DIW81_10795 [Planctomycetaceae bacterium]|nr:hypothetical protein [Rubinisphaera sp.]HCS52064.1 hypothetical protein [Planctomycetaceae bacterium]